MSEARFSHRSTRAALALGLILAAAPLAAQTAGQPASTAAPTASVAAGQQTITFEDAIRIALQRNSSVLLAKNATALDAADVRQQKNQYLPDFRASTSTAENVGRSFNTSDGAVVDQASQSVSAGVSSSITVFDASRGSALRGARLEQQAGTADLARTRQTVVFTVASDFLGLVNQQEQLRVQEQNLAAEEEQLRQIQAFVNAGVRPVADLYSQQAAVANARASLVDARRNVEVAKVDLMQTLQLDPRVTYAFQAPAVDEQGAAARSFSLDSLMSRALGERADLAAAQARVGAAEQGIKEAQGGRLPTVSVSAGYNTAYNSASDPAFLDQLNQRRGGSVSVGVSIPIFDRGNTKVAEQRAQLQADNARIQLDTQKQQVALDIRRAYLDFAAAQERLRASQAQQSAATQALTAVQERYQVGKATLVEVTQARTSLLQASSALVSARYNLVFQQALMTYYTGELDPANVTLG
ncbi:MAG TPA: TolC family protein [Longimicrobiaceae bacterium]|nr:TolC family protein [Longimicrobiaceae bacterium]